MAIKQLLEITSYNRPEFSAPTKFH